MSAADNGGPAFPAPEASAQHFGGADAYMGMTLRDYFAAKALAGMASTYHEHWTVERAAEAAYELADSMLKARAL